MIYLNPSDSYSKVCCTRRYDKVTVTPVRCTTFVSTAATLGTILLRHYTDVRVSLWFDTISIRTYYTRMRVCVPIISDNVATRPHAE